MLEPSTMGLKQAGPELSLASKPSCNGTFWFREDPLKAVIRDCQRKTPNTAPASIHAMVMHIHVSCTTHNPLILIIV